MGSIPRSWFAAAAAAFFALAVIAALSHPSVNDKGVPFGGGPVVTTTCESPWTAIRAAESTTEQTQQCAQATTGRQNVAIGFALLGGVASLTFAASFVRRVPRPVAHLISRRGEF